MTTIHVVIEPAKLTRSASGAITGPIWLKVGEQDFPKTGWRDLPVVLVASWLQAAMKLHTGRTSREMCSFVEGPYAFAIEGGARETWLISFIDSHTPTGVEVAVSPFGFSGLLAAAGGSILSACRANEWGGRDIDALAAACRSRVRV